MKMSMLAMVSGVEEKNHVAMKKVVELFQSNQPVCQSANLPVCHTTPLREVVPLE